MRRFALYAAPFLLLVVVWSCAGDGSDPIFKASLQDTGDGGGGECPPVDCEIVPGAPTLEDLQRDVFFACASFCHKPDGDGSAMLFDISPNNSDTTYESLLCVDSDCTIPECNPGGTRIKRVVPCEPDLSYLWWKVQGPPEFAIEGDLMPSGDLAGGIPQAQLNRIREWIAGGAQR